MSLFLAALAIYSPVRHFSYLNYDDPRYVGGNLHVRNGVTAEGVGWALRSTEAANWFPLTWLSHMADVQMFGLDSGGHHLTNVFLHAASAALLFLLLFRMTRAVWRSAFVAAIFALHPLHVESVAWVAERKDVLSAFFWMLTLLAYVHWTKRPSAARYALLIAAFACGLMSKSMIVTLPLVALLLDFWPLGRPMTKARVVEKLPLFALSAAVSAIIFEAQNSGGAVLSLDQLPVGTRLANALASYAVYLAKFFWPSNLAVFYPFPDAQSAWQVVAAGVVVAVISAVVISQRARRPYLVVGWLWYLATLLPVIGIVQIGLQSRADRYTYIPLIGFSIMLAWGTAELGARQIRIVSGVAILAVGGWTAVTCSYLLAWQDSVSLFQHAVHSTSGNYVAYNNLGAALRDRSDYDAAIADFRVALAIRPSYAEAQSNLGESFLRLGRTGEAEAHVAEALRLNPALPDAHVNLGAILSKQGRVEDAAAQYREALQLDPADADAHAGLGAILTDIGPRDQALQELTEAERLEPDDADTHYNLGRLYGLTGRTADAIAEFTRAIELRSNDPQSHFNLGVALATADQLDGAIKEFRTAVSLSPGYAHAHFNLGNALAQRGDCAAAVPEFTEALRLTPELVEARQNLEACRGGR